MPELFEICAVPEQSAFTVYVPVNCRAVRGDCAASASVVNIPAPSAFNRPTKGLEVSDPLPVVPPVALPVPVDVDPVEAICATKPNAPVSVASVQPPNSYTRCKLTDAPVLDVPASTRSICAPWPRINPSNWTLAGVELPVAAEVVPGDVPLPVPVPVPLPAPVPVPFPDPMELPLLAPLVPGGVSDMPTKTSFSVTVMVQSGFTL